MNIRDWVEQTFAGAEPKVFLELGARRGEDTRWIAAIENSKVIAFEPDPRDEVPILPNVITYRAAVSSHNGTAPFIMSDKGWGKEWTDSSSLKKPKNHLRKFPVSFGRSIFVRTVTLDSICAGMKAIDFIWCDIQGAEGDMVRGAQAVLNRTHYLYTEFSDDEMYEGQPTLAELLAMIPQFRIVEIWPDDVLLENTNWQQKEQAA